MLKQEKLQVLLVDDHAVLLSGLRLLLGNTPDLMVVGEAQNRASAIEQCNRLLPDVLVLDINLGVTNGLELIPEVQKISPSTNILLLTMYSEEAYLEKAIKLGAKGYVLKNASDKELLSAIRTVSRGESYLDPVLATSLVVLALRKQQKDTSAAGDDRLSIREKEVLGLVALGYTNQQIAEDLVISIKTVETHRAHIKSKLGLKKRSDLVQYALEHQLVPER